MENKKLLPWQLLDGTTLKLIAMVCMTIGHVGDNFFPEHVWTQAVGRIAMPVFAFCVAEGFAHTHDRMKYLRRMGLFALASEVPFDLVTAGKMLEFSHQNIMFTFFWAILGLILFEKVTASGTKAAAAGGAALLIVFAVMSLILGTDYNILGVGIVFIYYLLRGKAPVLNNAAAAAWHVLLRNKGIYWFGLLGFIPVLCYNGKRGRGLKWLFYVFYPGHLLLIWAVKMLLR